MITYSDKLYYNLIRNSRSNPLDYEFFWYDHGILLDSRAHKCVQMNNDTNKEILTGHERSYLFLDQEPWHWESMDSLLPKFLDRYPRSTMNVIHSCFGLNDYFETISDRVKLKYYFYHGLLCSKYWFADYEFYSTDWMTDCSTKNYSYLMLNNLTTKYRSYRLILTNLLKNTIKNNLVSIRSTQSELVYAKNIYPGQLEVLNQELDLPHQVVSSGSQSANIPVDLFRRTFLNVVTETCFYESYNHLTEKIFKPIVCCVPFIVASTPGTLQYLKKYGFETFDDIFDESYDNILDPIKRIEVIAKSVSDFDSLPHQSKVKAYKKAIPKLLHNRNHFYKHLPRIVLAELESTLS